MLIDLMYLWNVLALTYIVFAKVIPWAGRILAVYLIHGARQDVYRVAQEVPALRKTVLFRDIDHLLAHLLYLAQDHSWDSAWKYRARSSSKTRADRPEWRSGHYARELAELEEIEARQLAVLNRAVYVADFGLNWKLASTNILTALLVVPVALVGVAVSFSTKRIVRVTVFVSETLSNLAEPVPGGFDYPGVRTRLLISQLRPRSVS